MELIAAQHVYSSVKRDQSPSNRQGYQTLYYTHDRLERSEVEAIEARCIYYASPDYAPPKYQFYTLPSGKAVIGCIHSIPEPDEFGRKGMYLAHNFIFDVTTWQKLHANPFAILNDLPFVDTLTKAQQQGDLRTGNLEAISIENMINQDWLDYTLNLSRQWSPEHLRQLVSITKAAQTDLRLHQPLALIGQEEQILELLRVVFLVLTPQERPYCSFDTYANGCDWPRTQIFFWGQGFPTLEGWKLPGSIHAVSHQVQTDSNKLPSYTLYLQWLRGVLDSKQTPGNFHEQQIIITFFERLRANQPLQPAILDFANTPAFRELMPSYQGILNRRFLALFSKKLTDQSTLGQVLIRIDYQKKLAILITPPKPSELANHLYDKFCANEPMYLDTSDPYYEDILKLAETNPNLKILLLVADQRWKDWQATLNQLTSEQYQKFSTDLTLYLVGNTWVAICAKHFDYWLRDIFPQRDAKQLPNILNALQICDDKTEIEKFAEIIPSLNKQDRQVIHKWLEENPKVLAPVRKAFERLIKEQLVAQQEATKSVTNEVKPESQEKSWFGRIGQIFTPLNRPDKTEPPKQDRKKPKG